MRIERATVTPSAGGKMARRAAPSAPKSPASLSPDQMRQGVVAIRRRIADLKELDIGVRGHRVQADAWPQAAADGVSQAVGPAAPSCAGGGRDRGFYYKPSSSVFSFHGGNAIQNTGQAIFCVGDVSVDFDQPLKRQGGPDRLDFSDEVVPRLAYLAQVTDVHIV